MAALVALLALAGCGGGEAGHEVSFTDNDHATWVPVSGECWRTRDGLMQAESLPFTRMGAD